VSFLFFSKMLKLSIFFKTRWILSCPWTCVTHKRSFQIGIYNTKIFF
jgi:hypothetical protein